MIAVDSSMRLNRSKGVPRIGALLTLFWGLMFCLGLLWWIVDPNGQYFALGAAASLIVSAPLLSRHHAIASPWTILATMVYVSAGIRGLAISAEFNIGDRTVDQLFLLGHSTEYFLVPTLLHLLSLSLLSGAYAIVQRHVRPSASSGWLSGSRLPRRTPIVAIILAAIGFVAFLLYVRGTGGFNLGVISAKRVVGSLTLDDDYQSHGGLRVLNELANIGLWLLVAHYASMGAKLRGSQLLILLVLGLNAILLPVYRSSRTDALLALAVAFLIFYFLRPALKSLRGLMVGTIVVLLLLGAMTALRSGGGTVEQSTAIIDGVAEGVVYNRNLGDMLTTSHIVHHVPSPIPFQHGATIWVWALAPIPRALWHDKPVVNAGPLIGEYIYGTRQGGVPAGLTGDLYLNFGVIGVLLGSLLAGALLGAMDNWRRRRLSFVSPRIALVYVPLALFVPKTLLTKGIGGAFFTGFMHIVLVIACLVAFLLIKSSRRPTLYNPTSRNHGNTADT